MYDPDQQKPPDDYDVFYSDEQVRRVPMKSHQYTMNRDVRSKDNKNGNNFLILVSLYNYFLKLNYF